MDNFIKLMPKIELHAHLNGSLTTSSLLKLGKDKYGETNADFEEICKNFRSDSCKNKSLSDCFKKFQIAHSLTDTTELLQKAVFYVLEDFYSDNIIYLELRTTPKNTAYMSKTDYLECVLESILISKIKYNNMIVKILPSIDRSQGTEEALDTIFIILNLLKNPIYEDIIKGIDFSGNPEKLTFRKYETIFNIVKQNKLKVVLHCGEIENDSEIEEMILFGMDRCGHGTFIKGKNLELLQERKIPVECCLSSNIQCGTVENINVHHFKELFSSNVPVMICTDDFGVFDSNLSQEFTMAVEAFNLTKNDLLKLNNYALDASFANESEKMQLQNVINEYFKENC